MGEASNLKSATELSALSAPASHRLSLPAHGLASDCMHGACALLGVAWPPSVQAACSIGTRVALPDATHACSHMTTSSFCLALICVVLPLPTVLVFFLVWYVINVMYNDYNKTVLKDLNLPWTISALQLGIGLVLWVTPLWLTGVRKMPQITMENVRALCCGERTSTPTRPPMRRIVKHTRRRAPASLVLMIASRECSCLPGEDHPAGIHHPRRRPVCHRHVARRRLARFRQRRQIARASLQRAVWRGLHERSPALAGQHLLAPGHRRRWPCLCS